MLSPLSTEHTEFAEARRRSRGVGAPAYNGAGPDGAVLPLMSAAAGTAAL
jgi:hypothetical protein